MTSKTDLKIKTVKKKNFLSKILNQELKSCIYYDILIIQDFNYSLKSIQSSIRVIFLKTEIHKQPMKNISKQI